MISKKERDNSWYSLDEYLHRFSGVCYNFLKTKGGSPHKIFGIYHRLYKCAWLDYWDVNGKSLDYFKRVKNV